MARPRKEVDTSTYAGKFAVHIKALREKRKLSVQELAEKSGLNISTLYYWESATASPLIDQLPTLADALGVKIGRLFPENTQ